MNETPRVPTTLQEASDLIAFLLVEIKRLADENALLRRENAELRARLEMNSSNSSKPPSSDPPWRKGMKCWGSGTNGSLGDGTFVTKSTPVDVDGISSSAASVVAGYGSVCARLQDGGVKCWGANGNGQIGDGTTASRVSPVAVACQ